MILPIQSTGAREDRPLDALVFDGSPYLVEAQKGKKPVAVYGADVYRDEFVRAAIQSGMADRYVFFNRDYKDALHQQEAIPPLDGTSVATPGNIEELKRFDRVALLSFRPHPQNFVPLRSRIAKPWPIVSVIHALSSVSFSNLVCQLLTRDMTERDAVICSTDAGRRAIRNLLEQAAGAYGYDPAIAPTSVRLPIIPIGVDCRHMAGNRAAARQTLDLDERAAIILYFGRMTPYAKADLGPLICCYRELRRRAGEQLLLIIAGDDSRHSMAEGLRQYAASLGCASGVRVLPDVSLTTKRQLFAAADVFVAPSDHIQETFGIALVEALAAGLPVVASDWSGFREVIDHEVTGFLVPTYWVNVDGALELTATPVTFETRNTLMAGMTIIDNEQLFARLFQLVTDAELRKRMGETAMRIARERYDWAVVTRRYRELFTDLLSVSAPAYVGRPRGPFTYDVQDIFSHYPRGVLRPDTELTVSDRGHDWLSCHFPLSTRSDFPFDDSEIEELLRNVASAPARPRIRSLVASLVPAHHEIRATWFISRLLKYGLLRVASSRGA